jgi:threonine dehydratase
MISGGAAIDVAPFLQTNDMDIPVLPSFNDVCLAHTRIAPHIHRTPVMSSASINKILGCEILFKCENLQKVGAFKFRGATNAILALLEQQPVSAVCTHSSGNHAAALALAAGLNGLKAFIVMPRTAPKIKIEAVKGYGGIITFCEPTLKSREETLAQIVHQTGAKVVHPYNMFEVICGQATAAKELIEDSGRFDIMMAPVGGGGLMSGTAITTVAMLPECVLIGGEPAGAADARQSLSENRIVPSVNPKTIADGLLTSLGSLTFPILKNNGVQILTASDPTTLNAMQMVWERMKIVIEPSSAVPLAVIMEHQPFFKGKKVGVILSGGNADVSAYFNYMAEKLRVTL